MSVKMKPGVWRQRYGPVVTVQMIAEAHECRWIGSDGLRRHDDGRIHPDWHSPQDLVEWQCGPAEPQAQPDAAEELAALRDDRDRWQARAKQAEGRVATLTQDLAAATENRDAVFRRIHETENDRDKWRRRVAELERQVSDLQAQLEAAAHAPDLRGDVERVAAERDAAREEVRGLQVRAEQAEGDARQATAKMRHLEGEASKWRAQVTVKNDRLIRTEATVDALRSVILDLFERMRNDD